MPQALAVRRRRPGAARGRAARPRPRPRRPAGHPRDRRPARRPRRPRTTPAAATPSCGCSPTCAWAPRTCTRCRTGPASWPARPPPGLTDDDARRLDPREESSLVEAVDHPPAAGWTSRRGHTLTAAGAARVQRAGRHAAPGPRADLPAAARAGRGHRAAARPGHRGRRPRRARRRQRPRQPRRLRRGGRRLRRRRRAAHPRRVPRLAGRRRGARARPGRRRAGGRRAGVLGGAGAHRARRQGPGVGHRRGPGPGRDPVPRLRRHARRPTAPSSGSGWLTDVRELPYPLRGDAESLPVLDLLGAVTHKDVERGPQAVPRRRRRPPGGRGAAPGLRGA